jgi:LacI family transcriptional regulator
VPIPEEVSLIGYDDIAASRLTCPALTTVRQPTFEKGRVAARLLIDLIEGKPVESEHTVLPVELIERESLRVLK